MTTIQYREIVYDGFQDAEIVDENLNLDLKHFAQACGQSPEWILQLLEYEILPAVTTLEAAVEMAGILHEDGHKSFDGGISYGDVDHAFSGATYIESDTVLTPKVHHAAMETPSVLAIPRPGDVLEVRTPCQMTFGVQHSVAQVLRLPLSKMSLLLV